MENQVIRRANVAVAGVMGTLLLCGTPVLRAMLLPGFSAELAWGASNVVVVSETDRPGQFKVLLSWKGTLAHDSIIDVPDMIPLQSGADRALNGNVRQQIQATRLVLFLQEVTVPNGSKANWIPASASTSSEFRMKTSVAWLQDSRAICFGPDSFQLKLVLKDCGMSELQLWGTVRDVNNEQGLLENISKIPDRRVRAEELAPFVAARYRVAQSYAFQQLEACGQAAVPTVAAILQDLALLDHHGRRYESWSRSRGNRPVRNSLPSWTLMCNFGTLFALR